MDIDRSPVLNLLRVAHRLEGRLTTALAPWGLSLSQLRILWLVAEAGDPPTVNQLRERMLDPAANVSRLLNKLMDGGLVAKVRGQDDQRVVRIGLTAGGRKALGQGGAALAAELGQLDRLPEDRAATLAEVLKFWG